jgi:hypothetical protein
MGAAELGVGGDWLGAVICVKVVVCRASAYSPISRDSSTSGIRKSLEQPSGYHSR